MDHHDCLTSFRLGINLFTRLKEICITHEISMSTLCRYALSHFVHTYYLSINQDLPAQQSLPSPLCRYRT